MAGQRARVDRDPPRTAWEKAKRPIVEFFELEAAGGILLMIATAAALLWANSPAGSTYYDFWHTYLSLGVGEWKLKLSLAHWINDGLMAVFFFLVGLEIKRELLTGELSTPRQAALPIMAAVGGMVVPAGLYAVLNAGGAGAPGWGIPMATDIAFALGVLILLGKRIPLGLKIFLTALAIVDDLGAVLVIAVFYTSGLSFGHLGVGLALVAFLFLLGRFQVRRNSVYIAVGIVVWYLFLKSGVHATIAGVLVAAAIPHRTLLDRPEFTARVRRAMEELDEEDPSDPHAEDAARERAMHTIHHAAERWSSPLQRLEHALVPYISFGIMPVFALANAGVVIDWGNYVSTLAGPIPMGIVLGLVVGKQVGIFAFSWIAVKAGLATLPAGVGWRSIHGAATLAGIGFTMSLFIANLAFPDAATLDTAKVGVLSASLLAGILGTLILIGVKPKAPSA